jgi:hypothetical protein
MRTLRVAAAAALIAIGSTALARPRRSSRQFGIGTDHPDAIAFVRALGARDLALGLVLLSVEGSAGRRALGWTSLLGLCDAAIGLGARGPRPQQLLHVGGFLALALAALVGTDT